MEWNVCERCGKAPKYEFSGLSPVFKPDGATVDQWVCTDGCKPEPELA